MLRTEHDIPILSMAAMPPSVLKILVGAMDAIASRGVTRLSMTDIIEASGVSRGTLYRYFPSKDDVLAAVAEYICVGFETGIRDAGGEIADPIERWRAIMRFYSHYTLENTPFNVFRLEPGFHLDFFQSRFDRYKAAMREALHPVFTHFERLLGQRLDRDTIVEVLIRLQLSTLLVPGSESWTAVWDQSPERVALWLDAFVLPADRIHAKR